MDKEINNSPEVEKKYIRISHSNYIISLIIIGLFCIVINFILNLIKHNPVIGSAPISFYLFWLLLTPVTISRFHDFNKSGFFALLMFIPFVNVIAMIYLCFKKGDAGKNKYGELTSNAKTKSSNEESTSNNVSTNNLTEEDNDDFSSKYDVRRHKKAEPESQPININTDNSNTDNNNFHYIEDDYNIPNENQDTIKKHTQPPTFNKTSDNQNKIKVDINTAQENDLSKLYGIGPILAKKIIKHRTEVGYFYNIDEFATELNINEHIVDTLKEQITFSKPTTISNNNDKDYNGRIIDF